MTPRASATSWKFRPSWWASIIRCVSSFYADAKTFSLRSGVPVQLILYCSWVVAPSFTAAVNFLLSSEICGCQLASYMCRLRFFIGVRLRLSIWDFGLLILKWCSTCFHVIFTFIFRKFFSIINFGDLQMKHQMLFFKASAVTSVNLHNIEVKQHWCSSISHYDS